MNLTIKNIAVAAVLALATPAMAHTFLKPRSMAEKYRDHGAKPTKARSDWAAIEARALMGVDGKTDVEITTGHFEGIGGPGGTLERVRVKVFENGRRIETEKDKPDAATTTLSFDRLHRGQDVEVKAHVSGDRRRKDVVTATTAVKWRPDLEAMRLDVQPRVVVNAPVAIRGLIAEVNGDVGARVTCRLFADGVQIGAIPGAWVDASSAVTCEFRTSFASLGSRNLTLRVTDVEPGDFDTSNNEVSSVIEVANVNVAEVRVVVSQEDDLTIVDSKVTDFQGGVPVWTQIERRTDEMHLQSIDVFSTHAEELPVTGRITLRHSTGGVPLESISIAVQDLPEAYDTCRYGSLSDSRAVTFCSGHGVTELYVFRYAGMATYVREGTITDASGTQPFYSTWSDGPGGTMVPLGADYSAELLYETAQGVYGGVLTVPIEPQPYSLHQSHCRSGAPSRPNRELCLTQATDGTFIYAEGRVGN